MPDIRVRVSDEFYWWLMYYKELHGHRSLAETLLAVTRIGYERIQPNKPMQLGKDKWGGYRHGEPKHDEELEPPTYTPPPKPYPDLPDFLGPDPLGLDNDDDEE